MPPQSETITPDKITAEFLVNVGKIIGGVQTPSTSAGADPFVIVPRDYKVESLRNLMPPDRIRQNVVMLEAGSFIDYVNRFKTDDTLIFADVTDQGASFIAVLDYHSKAPDLKVAYACHNARFGTVRTREFNDWMAADGKKMDQIAFATFLEEAQKVFVSPSGADLLEIVKSLEGHSDARFNSAIRLDSGARKFTFDEDVVVKGNATTVQGGVEIPAMIKAGISPFEGTDAWEINARLKYRIENRKLVLWYETINPHRIVRDAVVMITEQIAEKTKIIPLIGRP